MREFETFFENRAARAVPIRAADRRTAVSSLAILQRLLHDDGFLLEDGQFELVRQAQRPELAVVDALAAGDAGVQVEDRPLDFNGPLSHLFGPHGDHLDYSSRADDFADAAPRALHRVYVELPSEPLSEHLLAEWVLFGHRGAKSRLEHLFECSANLSALGAHAHHLSPIAIASWISARGVTMVQKRRAAWSILTRARAVLMAKIRNPTAKSLMRKYAAKKHACTLGSDESTGPVPPPRNRVTARADRKT